MLSDTRSDSTWRNSNRFEEVICSSAHQNFTDLEHLGETWLLHCYETSWTYVLLDIQLQALGFVPAFNIGYSYSIRLSQNSNNWTFFDWMPLINLFRFGRSTSDTSNFTLVLAYKASVGSCLTNNEHQWMNGLRASDDTTGIMVSLSLSKQDLFLISLEYSNMHWHYVSRSLGASLCTDDDWPSEEEEGSWH